MNRTAQREPLAIGSGGTDARVLGLTMPNRARRLWILPAVWQVAPPQEGFILTPSVGGPGGGVSCCSARCVARCSLAAAEVKTEQTTWRIFVHEPASARRSHDDEAVRPVRFRCTRLCSLLFVKTRSADG
jgi:hypothetical protein